MINARNYINGQLVDAVNGEVLFFNDTATTEIYTTIPRSRSEDVDLAVEAAQQAFPSWSSLSIQERSEFLYAIAEGIKEKHDYLAGVESRDNGKPYKLAHTVDIPRAITNFDFFSTAIKHFNSQAFEMRKREAINYTLKLPLGVVGTISPWNLPLYLFSWKVAPALAVGNTVVAKPSEVTPMTAFELSKICQDVGLPPGVFNIVHGLGGEVGEAITTHEKVKAISFTGGTVTGARIASVAAPKFKKLSLELGGKNPNIIFADANWEKMMSTTLRSSFANQGEICLCGSRIYIEDTIYDRFKEEFVRITSELTVGDPNTEVDLGAIVSQQHFEKIQSYIELAKTEGGNILTGGEVVNPGGRCENGYFLRPTVIEGLDHMCRTNQEEIFGPVVTLQPFSTEEEVLSYANSTPYGLSATLWTENVSRVHRMVPKIDSGIIWVNCWLVRDLRTPFGGMKQSGVGREGGDYALEFFSETKNITIDYSD
ncbi:MAG: aldehyde dehydrogenase [Candidatus Kariarchaeaceae archaeon]